MQAQHPPRARRPHREGVSLIVHDGERAHAALVDSVGGGQETHPSRETRGLPDSANPLDPINDAHSRLKGFLRANEPFRRSGLQDYLNLFSVVFNPPGEVILKVELVLKRMIQTRKTMRYRALFSRNADEG